MIRRSLALLVLTLLFSTLASTGLAQRCYDEVRAGLSINELSQPATGRSAARLFRRAVELLEPSLPPLQRVVDLPVTADDPDREAFSYLADRQLLEPMWLPGEFSADAWHAALSKVAGWYALPVPVLDETRPSNNELLDSFAPIFDAAGEVLNPVALFAFDPAADQRIAFWATLRNGVYPRMIVVRPPGEPIDVQGDTAGALAHLGDCVVTPQNYVYTRADTAERLFLATNESRMVLLETVPPSPQLLLEAPVGQEASYLTFTAPEVADKVRYTALFLGPSVGFGALLRLLPQLRTNMSPQEIVSFLNGARNGL
ncbi:MAG: hypothetical protein AVDCRST_MAG86-3783 [uncultured Truepera sp.]|uniref:DUF1254 domain-containing protein n=1 Tax=uncultured Truepera sp. TaxID=543023 RepID=A0A6J4VVB4_9DEIN|nr:MAG: hypothetical protein AVDCRST_MAG86-3783 [uncultured Truepera sp.]